MQRLRLQIKRNLTSLDQGIVNFFIFHNCPPLCPLLMPVALMVSLNFLYALCTFCFTDPTLEDVARATSSSDIPSTFNISITSRWLSGSGANSVFKLSA